MYLHVDNTDFKDNSLCGGGIKFVHLCTKFILVQQGSKLHILQNTLCPYMKTGKICR